jgi:hypothetical protein
MKNGGLTTIALVSLMLFSVFAVAPVSAELICPSGMVSYWKFDKGAGSTAFDSVGTNHGTIYGATWTTGIVDGALNFDGSDDYVNIPHKQKLGWGFGDGSTWDNIVGTTSIITDDTWHHIAGTFDGNELRVYVDGNLEAIKITTGTIATNTRAVNIGASWGGGTWQRFFKGLVDEVAIYNRALSPEEIQQHYENGLNGLGYCEVAVCLGTCCNDSECTDSFATDITCKECCIAMGKYWKPNKDAACFGTDEPFDLCLNWCPQCCNGIDDDNDEKADYPLDKQCTCGLDPSETDPLPPVPELSTIILSSIGLLVLAGYVVLRRKNGQR